uniref:Type I potassium channel toxin protein n=1 Tax=Anemonia sulcata TaxID=6108 RepID=A0A0S1M179_ANESU|nr:type I potassium channel toxin protein [Anemonia sulcata]
MFALVDANSPLGDPSNGIENFKRRGCYDAFGTERCTWIKNKELCNRHSFFKMKCRKACGTCEHTFH